jgi:hypothetical protein
MEEEAERAFFVNNLGPLSEVNLELGCFKSKLRGTGWLTLATDPG